MEKTLKTQKGITLIALIITVIILLILAGTAIAASINGGSLFTKTSDAKDSWNAKVNEEETEIKGLLDILDEAATGVKVVRGDPKEWVIEGNTVIKYLGTSENLVIPNTIGETKITAIGVRFCYGGELSGDIAENISKIKTLSISPGIEVIGDNAFFNCSNITGNINIPNTVTTIDSLAFFGCSGLTGDLIIPNSVTTIGNHAFNGCTGLSGKLVIPNSVTSLGMCTVANTCKWDSVKIDVTDIPASWGASCSLATSSLIFGENVKTIGNSAFSGCSNITGDLIIPSNVTTINNSAFSGCTGIDGDLIISDGVTTVKDAAFSGCTNVSGKLYIGKDVTNFGLNGVFSGLGLGGTGISETEIWMPNIPGSLFFGKNAKFNGPLKIGNTVTEIGPSAFKNCTGLTGNIVIPDSVTEIKSNAFEGCTGLNGTLTLGNGLTKIQNNAFTGCTGLTGDITIPNGITYLGVGVFEGCSGFNGDLTIGSGITTIYEYEFKNCTGLTGNYTIPNTITYIYASAFEGCTGYSSITIPSTVGQIFSNAFKNVAHIYYSGSASGSPWGANAVN